MKNISLLLLLSIALITSLPCCKKTQIESCGDNIKNQNEIEVDCGGVCMPCPIDTYIVSGTHHEWSGPNSSDNPVGPTLVTISKSQNSVHLEFNAWWKRDYNYRNEDQSYYYYSYTDLYNGSNHGSSSSLSFNKSKDSIFLTIELYLSSHSGSTYSLLGVKK